MTLKTSLAPPAAEAPGAGGCDSTRTDDLEQDSSAAAAALDGHADRNFKRPSGARLPTHNARNQP